MFQENIRYVVIPLIQQIQRVVHGKRQDIVDGLSTGLRALYNCIPLAEPPAQGASQRLPQMSENWLGLALGELSAFNKDGVESISSVAECFWKVNGIMNKWHASGRDQFFFRGEHSFDWDLESSVKRQGLASNPKNLFAATTEELDRLTKFQQRAVSDKDFRIEVFGPQNPPSCDDVSWWAHLQHFESGTRLLDITSSPFTALFFACVDWDGTVDDHDGAFYLFPDTRSWRRSSSNLDIIHGVNVGPTDAIANSVKELFSVQEHPQTVRIWRSPGRNERLLAQDGLFLWAPMFDKAYAVGQHFKFRVSKDSKRHILRELYSIGYTAKRLIRGRKGIEAHERICSRINVCPETV